MNQPSWLERKWVESLPQSLREPFELASEILDSCAWLPSAYDNGLWEFAHALADIREAATRLDRALDEIGNEFTAVADRVPRYRLDVAPNAHELVCNLGNFWTWQIIRAVKQPKSLANGTDIKVTPDDFQGKYEIAGGVLSALRMPKRIDQWEGLRCRLEQEVCRAYDRRLATGRRCQGDADTPVVKWDEQTEARNKWLYEQCCALVRFMKIIRDLPKESRAWEPINSIAGIKRAANAYAERYELPPIPRRQAGRRRA